MKHKQKIELEEMVTCWTIQPFSVYQRLRSNGSLSTPKDKSSAQPRLLEEMYQQVQTAHNWMFDHMTQEQKSLVPKNHTPIWVWIHWRGKDHPRPDLRYGGYYPKGTACVRLTLRIPKRLILQSRYDLWAYCLCGMYCDESITELYYFTQTVAPKLSPEETQAVIERSWETIFDLRNQEKDGYYVNTDTIPIQGVVPIVYLDQVIAVEPFTAR